MSRKKKEVRGKKNTAGTTSMPQENAYLSAKSETALREEAVLAFWKERHIFEKTLSKGAPSGEFVFYDGPPFATGLPHYGSLLSSIIKDVIPRYKTMRGYHVRRRWGWDCHGLPIEHMLEKELGLKSKKDILELGIDRFNEACRSAVLRFADEWEKYVDRVGRWVDFRGAYMTMDNTFIESVWWALHEIYKKGLLYEGRKVLLYCPRCETPLSKAEIAMDNSYKDVTEESVFVKFRLTPESEKKAGMPENTFLLAWTTTPWTLPGNVALAVNSGVSYDIVPHESGAVVIASNLRSIHFPNVTPLATVVGKKMVGLSYHPLFDVPKVLEQKKKNSYTVLPGDFVTTDEGTGIVHTAVMYGEDDYALGLAHDLPMVPLLDQSGHFTDDAPGLVRGQYFKKAEKVIKDDLDARGLLFAREQHTHSYPHCHRCGTALIYNAITSWFINIAKIKKQLLKTNERINWVPEHLKHGRYQHILENAPDWTISRNRFWASPLPIWKHPTTGAITIIGSLDELKRRTKRSGNRYIAMRHGESRSNIEGIANSLHDSKNTLTENGKEQVIQATEVLKKEGITYIYTSPLPRAQETAHMIARVLGISPSHIVTDERLTENQFGVFEGKSIEAYNASFHTEREKMISAPQGGESWSDVKCRMTACLYNIEKTLSGETILIVSHSGPLSMLYAGARGLNMDDTALFLKKEWRGFHNAEVRTLPFVPLPHNVHFELDLHRPYIDDIMILDDDGTPLSRIPEVIDGWVESGSMPFAEWHYPFEDKQKFESQFPADFIAEYIAQTRTWFYYMHSVSVLLFGEPSFKNVVSTGTILAEDGSKMSKSKGNYTDPLQNLNLYGADALRYYLMASPVMSAEDVRFSDGELKEVRNRVINMLWNTYKFYELSKHQWHHGKDPHESPSVLDQWILARLDQWCAQSTEGYDRYDLPAALRPFRGFIDDLSTWYVRRSRERIKGDDDGDRQYALATLRHVLLTTALLIAPTMPFIAESIYRGIEGEEESVHLAAWPRVVALSKDRDELLSMMEETRRIVSEALQVRAKAAIKVRQPLQSLTCAKAGKPLPREFQALILDEVNVKQVIFTESSGNVLVVTLDLTITPELQEEGDIRDLLRHIQQLRKEAGLLPSDVVRAAISTNEYGKELVETHKDRLMRTAALVAIDFVEVVGAPLVTSKSQFVVALTRTA